MDKHTPLTKTTRTKESETHRKKDNIQKKESRTLRNPRFP
jgi:hypothetical protein